MDIDPSILVSTESETPSTYALSQNYPNPFNPTTSIEYELAQTGQVRLTVYDVLGKEVRSLVDGQQSAGRYVAEWDGRDASGQSVASGVYLYRLEAGDYVSTRRMTLLK